MKTFAILLICIPLGCLPDRGSFLGEDSSHTDLSQSDVGRVDSVDFGPIPGSAIASVVLSDIKTAVFSWNLVEGATEYKILEDKDGSGTFIPIIDAIESQISEQKYSISLYQNVNSKYMLQSCNQAGCSDSNLLEIKDSINEGIGYFKADNTGTNDSFGVTKLSANGEVMVVGAIKEESQGTGINSGQGDDNSASNAGAAYVFEKQDGNWTQTAYFKASNSSAEDRFGSAVSISGDGSLIAVGAPGEASKGIGVNGAEEADNSAPETGAVYVFAKSSNRWTQIAYIKASNSDASDKFGEQVALSADGTTLAVSATDDASNSKVINQGLNDNSAVGAGAVYIFSRAGNTWSQQSYLKTNETTPRATMGFSLAINGDGNVVATNHAVSVFIFEREGQNWTQKTKIDPAIVDTDDAFGYQVALSLDGKTLLVSAPEEDGNGKGTQGNPTNNDSIKSGAAYVFVEEGGVWTQEAYLKSSNSKSGDTFGFDLDISYDGNFAAISSVNEGSSATGVNGKQSDNNSPSSGAVYIFERKVKEWRQVSYLKATNTALGYWFGSRLGMSGDGFSLAVGSLDSSAATGINGDASDLTKPQSGSVFLY